MRGEQPKRPYSAATILDEEGTVRYHIIPARITMFGVAGMALLAILAIILAVIVIKNRVDLNDLNRKISIDENQRDK